jgi:hypothetical protein
MSFAERAAGAEPASRRNHPLGRPFLERRAVVSRAREAVATFAQGALIVSGRVPIVATTPSSAVTRTAT